MRYSRQILVLSLWLLASCGGHAPAPQVVNPAPLVPLYGSTVDGVTEKSASGVFTLSFDAIDTERLFKLDLPAGTVAQSWTWSGQTDAALTLAVAAGGDLEVAVVPLVSGTTVTVTLSVITGSTSPVAPAQVAPGAAGFTAVDGSGGQALLAWTQDLPGDYDFDGAVTLADLKALPAHWQQHLDRSQSGAAQLTAYWLDADGDGTVDQGDIDIVGRNLGLQVAGYRLKQNSLELAGAGPGAALKAESDGQPHAGLPRSFTASATGSSKDSWNLIPVDPAGADLGNAFTGGGNLTLNVDISGTDLLALDPSGTKLSSRVIVPIDLIDSVKLPLPTATNGTVVSITNVPRATVLFAQLLYKPAVTVTSALGSSLHSASAADPGVVTTSVAFEIPSGANDVAIDAKLVLTPNTSGGGYSLTLNTSTTADGGPATASTAQLNFATSEMRRDTNSDGDLANEFPFPDSDRDCISDPMLSEIQDKHAPLDGQTPTHISGRVETLDLPHGLVTLSQVQTHDGPVSLPAQLTLRCAENMRFAPPPPAPPQGGGQQPPPGGQNPPPPPNGDEPPLKPGAMVDAAVFTVVQGDGTPAYWAESMHPLGAPGAPPPSAVTLNPQGDGSVLVKWQAGAGYSGYRLQRFSSLFSGGGPGSPLNFCAPADNLDWSQDLPAGTTEYHDTATQPSQHYTYELFGLSGSADPVYLGTTQPPPQGGGGGGGQ